MVLVQGKALVRLHELAGVAGAGGSCGRPFLLEKATDKLWLFGRHFRDNQVSLSLPGKQWPVGCQ